MKFVYLKESVSNIYHLEHILGSNFNLFFFSILPFFFELDSQPPRDCEQKDVVIVFVVLLYS